MNKVDLVFNKKTILKDVKVASDTFSLAQGLMFARRKRVEKGLCLKFPQDLHKGAAITMWFCFLPYEILFVNSKFEVVDKVVLKPWKTTYIPKKKCKYIFESVKGTFDDVNLGDKVRLNFVR